MKINFYFCVILLQTLNHGVQAQQHWLEKPMGVQKLLQMAIGNVHH